VKARAIAAVIAAASIGVGAAVAIATAPAGAATPACTAAQLQPTFDGGGPAGGTLTEVWHFANLGNTCQTIGFVGALNFGADGRPLPTTVTWIGAKSTVTLNHGQRAQWQFSYTDPSRLGCAPEAATNMIVTPPNNTSPVLAGRGVKSCNGAFNATALTFIG
jgi:hypothetical protein